MRAVRVDGGEFPADVVVLAVGHSARAVYSWAADGGDRARAQADRRRRPHRAPAAAHRSRSNTAPPPAIPKLPPAFYELTANAAERGVYSFCMCPGGWIVPAATEPDGVVVNGMSLSRRDSPFANAGLVVSVERR